MLDKKHTASIVAVIVLLGMTVPVIAQPLTGSSTNAATGIQDGTETTVAATTTGTTVTEEVTTEAATTERGAGPVHIEIENMTASQLNLTNVTLTNVTVRTAQIENLSFKEGRRNVSVTSVTYDRLHIENTTIIQASATDVVITDREVAAALLGEDATRGNLSNLTLQGADLREREISNLTIDGVVIQNASIGGAAIQQITDESPEQAGNVTVNPTTTGMAGDDSSVDFRANNVSIERIEGVTATYLSPVNETTTTQQSIAAVNVAG